MTGARAILLNGPSSAGKSTLARALHAELPGHWLRWSLDEYLQAVEPPAFAAAPEAVPPEVPARVLAGFHGAAAAIAKAGNPLILDHVVLKAAWWDDLRAAFAGVPLLTVAVTCDPAELDRRERARGDREPGLARAQAAIVHAHGPHDLTLDTAATPVDACVRLVSDALQEPPMLNLLLAAAIAATPADFAWLVGTWRSQDGDETVEETWQPAIGHAMIGTSRTVAKDALVFSEFMSLEQQDGAWELRLHHYGRGLVGWASEGIQPLRCPLKALSKGHAVFAGREADGPVTITYDLVRPDRLKATVVTAKATFAFELDRR